MIEIASAIAPSASAFTRSMISSGVVGEESGTRFLRPSAAFALPTASTSSFCSGDRLGDVRLGGLDTLGEKLLVGSNIAVLDQIEDSCRGAGLDHHDVDLAGRR